jgi:hypothetical protein
MDIVHFMQGTSLAAPGSYVVEAYPDRPRQDQSPANQAVNDVAIDSYTRSGSSRVASELPAALQHAPDSGELDTCYCGHCSRCQARKAEQSESGEIQERRPVKQDVAHKETDVREDDQPAKANAQHELSDAESRQVEELRQRDQEVRAHEQAHAAAGARNVRFDYQSGPDGRQYAVGGSADIEMSAMSNDHEGKILEARKMRAAALAPADPSTQDMAVAARATRIEMEAMAEKTDSQHPAVTPNKDHAQIGYARDQSAAVSTDKTLFFAMG